MNRFCVEPWFKPVYLTDDVWKASTEWKRHKDIFVPLSYIPKARRKRRCIICTMVHYQQIHEKFVALNPLPEAIKLALLFKGKIMND